MRKFCWLAIALFYCSIVKAEPRTPVTLGVVAPLTGPSANIGNEMTQTLNLLADRRNAEPGKYSYRFIFEDGKGAVDSSPTTAVQKLTTLNGARFFIVATSGEIMQVGPLAEKQDLFMIAPYATLPAVKDLGDRVFRTAISVERGVDSISDYLQRQGDFPLALLTEQHTFSIGVSDLLRKRLLGHIVADETYPLDESELGTVLLRARAKHPKAYYFSCARPITCARITNQARQLGITEQFYSFLHMSDPEFLTITSSRANGFRFLSPPDDVSQSPEFMEFREVYRKRFSGSPKIDFLMRATYDAANAVIDGIEAAGASPSAVSRYLQSYKRQGALGLVHFDANGDIQDLNYVMKEVGNESVRLLQ